MVAGSASRCGFFRSGDMQGVFECSSMLRFAGFLLLSAWLREHFAVQRVQIGRRVLQRQRVLGGLQVVELGLTFVTKQASELGQGDWFF